MKEMKWVQPEDSKPYPMVNSDGEWKRPHPSSDSTFSNGESRDFATFQKYLKLNYKIVKG